MGKLDRRTMLLGASAGLLGACSIGDDLAGGARKQPKGGIGGTGIVGTLTDFGSLIINGLRVVVPPELRVETVFGSGDQARLAVGHNLTIEAETITGTLLARRVSQVHALVGPIQSLSASGADLVVAGVPVGVEQGAEVRGAKGQLVAVSGIWNQSEIIASRIDPVETAPVSAAGTLRYGAETGLWTIGALPVLLPQGLGAVDGSFATGSGYLHDAALKVERFLPGRFTGAAGALKALSVEGYLAPTPDAPFQSVDGLGHSFAEDTQLDAYVGKRTLFSGPYDGKFNLRDGLILEESLTRRRRQLRV